ncbi:hypothetical protein [Actinotalea sp. K2]|uniref:hypothetical protein n=1 Tax=Actinotalea sp. K2 TaxID=2939438 RepID=UPI002016BC46|nr:hypothetical protein [Actinotalea sp. K2]MCL3862857.1 hypothetical protein [Actinotalea sp. K2]
MRRLFWVGVGATGAVLIARRARQVARRYTPEGVAEQVEATGRRTTTALRGSVETFRTAMDRRERDLVATLLVSPEGGASGGRHQAATPPQGSSGTGPAPGTGRSPASSARPSGRVDDDEPLYDF